MWTKSFSRYTHILLVSAAVIIGSQISISLFESDFRVSIGIFGIFMSLILFGKYPILPVTVISALCVFFSRTLMHWLRFGSWNPQNYFPEMFFYLVYGILFFLYCRKNDYELSMYSLPWMFLFDYLAHENRETQIRLFLFHARISAIAKPMAADQILAVAVRMAGKVITARVT